ncbi:helix-turn-helix domain-containing protein [Lentzea flava]|uniref:helix-turn-helix domain-containing protein n=1 Tax=Lentzea flava TaxID=103732 RepID=UPI001E5A27CF|nr:helix-turn-helix transcriptional regulator [Lentzea flava]
MGEGDTERRRATNRGWQQVQIEWRLRKVMASRDIWSATELRELLVQRVGFEISLQSVSDLVKKQPVQVKMATLQALCTALQCTPNELFGIDTPRDVSLAEPDDAKSRSEM